MLSFCRGNEKNHLSHRVISAKGGFFSNYAPKKAIFFRDKLEFQRDTIIQTLSGIAYGIASVALPGVGGIIAKTAISVGTTVITDSYHGVGIGSILKNAASAFGLSLLFQGAKYLGVFDKLNFSHLIGNGRWVDFVSDKVFNKTLIMMDFGNYFIREFVVAGVSFGQRIVKWLWNNL